MSKNKKVKTNKYRCRHCGRILNRESSKKWIKSYCDSTDKYVHLTLVIK